MTDKINQPRFPWLKLLPAAIFVLTCVFYAGGSFYALSGHASQIEELNTQCDKLNDAINQIPAIQKDITHINLSQRKMEAAQETMRGEQIIMIKALARIEAKI